MQSAIELSRNIRAMNNMSFKVCCLSVYIWSYILIWPTDTIGTRENYSYSTQTNNTFLTSNLSDDTSSLSSVFATSFTDLTIRYPVLSIEDRDILRDLTVNVTSNCRRPKSANTRPTQTMMSSSNCTNFMPTTRENSAWEPTTRG